MHEHREAEIVRIVQDTARELGAKANVSYQTDEQGNLTIAWSYDLGWRWRRTHNVVGLACCVGMLGCLGGIFVLAPHWIAIVLLCALVALSVVLFFFSAHITNFISPIPTAQMIRLFSRISLVEAGFQIEDVDDNASTIHDE